MKWKILHESKRRLRVRAEVAHMTLREADIVEYYIRNIPGVLEVKVYDRTHDAVILYGGDKSAVVKALAKFRMNDEANAALVPSHTGREMSREFEDRIVGTILRRYIGKLIFPSWILNTFTVIRSLKYLKAGFSRLLKGKIDVPVLDATAVTVSVLRLDFKTASSIMFLLKIGEILEDWTHRKSVDDLARSMSLNIDKVWVKKDENEFLVNVNEVNAGDEIIVRTGNMIPLDGRVVSGEMTVNQASMTGESEAVPKSAGRLVYAGTVVEEGECVVRVEKGAGDGRYDRIVKMIEESEKLKSDTEDKASHLADKLVPYSLGTTILTYLITRNPTKALGILMVDFSCALKLAMPVAVLSAMREGNSHKISFKGGKFLEAVSDAKTIVFDKTGTLTRATPKVSHIVVFGDRDENELLRVAACLEEHFPHSMANAVVREASRRGLSHEECHSNVEYIVAHGITGIVEGEKVVIGSHHFVFEDEKCVIPDMEKFDAITDSCSHLYMAVGGTLAAVICIEDPLRDEAPEVIKALRKAGFERIVMMTGDSDRTARAIAAKVGVDEYRSEVLPEDKAAFVKAEHAAGRKVVMIGDGVNDAPALSEADAGVAVSTGAAIAREIADITITTEDLRALVTMKLISDALMKRIHANYRFIISFNLGLIIAGVAGILPPATSALLHNLSTLGIGLRSMTNLLD